MKEKLRYGEITSGLALTLRVMRPVPPSRTQPIRSDPTDAQSGLVTWNTESRTRGNQVRKMLVTLEAVGELASSHPLRVPLGGRARHPVLANPEGGSRSSLVKKQGSLQIPSVPFPFKIKKGPSRPVSLCKYPCEDVIPLLPSSPMCSHLSFLRDPPEAQHTTTCTQPAVTEGRPWKFTSTQGFWQWALKK